MPCSSCGGGTAANPAPAEDLYTVTLPNGEVKDNLTDHESKVAMTLAGGGRREKKR